MRFGLTDGQPKTLDEIGKVYGVTPRRVLLIGGGARSEAVRRLAPAILGCPVLMPEPSEYVAVGAARQAAWVLSGGEEPPAWTGTASELYEADPATAVRSRYAEVRDLELQSR